MVREGNGFAMLEYSYVTRWIWGNYCANDELQCYLYPFSSVSAYLYGGYRFEAASGLLLCVSEVAHGSHKSHGF